MAAHRVNADIQKAGISGIAPTTLYDSVGNITFSAGATPPTGAGYAYGSLFVQNDATTPGAALFVNTGTTTSASFVPENSVGSPQVAVFPFNEATLLVGDNHMYTAQQAMTVASITLVYSVAGNVGVGTMKKASGTTALTSGTAMHTTVTNGTGTTFDITKTANTTQTALLTFGGQALVAGDRVGFVRTTGPGTGGLLGGVITMVLYPT